jgi:Flp pilus assembly protein TadD
MTAAITCGSCGAKVKRDRAICPRCRSVMGASPAEGREVAHVSRRTALVSVAALGVSVAIAGGAWLTAGRTPADQPVQGGTRPDPLATRRLRPQETAVEGQEAPTTEAQKFFEPASEAAASYSDGNFASALEQYQAAIAKNPDDAEALSNLGQVLVRLGKVEEAIPYFDRAIGLIPNRWAYHFNRARALGILGRMEEAVNGYREAQRLFPNDYATTFNLGLALHRMGDEEAAVEAYKKAIALAPNDATFRMALGTSLERLQRPRDAAAAYDEYLRLAPSAPDADKVRARIAQLTQPSPPAPGQQGS